MTDTTATIRFNGKQVAIGYGNNEHDALLAAVDVVLVTREEVKARTLALEVGFLADELEAEGVRERKG